MLVSSGKRATMPCTVPPSPPRPRDRRALATAVREARAGRRLSQEELSLAAGLNRQFVYEVESGRRRVSFEAICAIAEALEMPMSELIDRFERARASDRD